MKAKTRIRSISEMEEKLIMAKNLQQLILSEKAKETDYRIYHVLMSELKEFATTLK